MDMNRLMKTMPVLAIALSVSIGCDHAPSNPEKRPAQFRFVLQNAVDGGTPLSSAMPPAARPGSALLKAVDLKAFDMVRIMVIDLSAYDSWPAFTLSETGRAYTANRNSWTGDPGDWWGWKDVWQDYATIVSDQTLEIRGPEAVGTVTGAIGYNEFLAGLFVGGRVRVWATGSGWGEEGETHDVTLANFTYIASAAASTSSF
jgi:hypothetical protein